MFTVIRTKVRGFLPAAMLLLLAAAASAPGQSGAKSDNAVKKGKALYTQHCVSCHGSTGTGEGPAATSLKVRPADLTQIANKYHGFPNEKVMDWIDGEKYAIGHGSREMPVWGKRFRRSTAAGSGLADEVQVLTRYIESIQKPK